MRTQTPIQRYRLLLAKLHVAMVEQHGEEAEEKIREEMDGLWREAEGFEHLEVEVASALLNGPAEACPGSDVPVPHGARAFCGYCNAVYDIYDGKLARHCRDSNDPDVRRGYLSSVVAKSSRCELAIVKLETVRDLVRTLHDHFERQGDERRHLASLLYDAVGWTSARGDAPPSAQKVLELITGFLFTEADPIKIPLVLLRGKLIAAGFLVVPAEVSEALHESA